MYHRKLDIPKVVSHKTKPPTDQLLVELWVLADKLLIPSLQNDVIQALEKLRAQHKTTGTKCLHYVYDKTGPGSPLRRLFVHQCAFNVASDWFSQKPGHFPQEMLIDLVQLLSESSSEDWKMRMSDRRDMVDFEVEEEEENCVE
jgi:hypothetical protein